MSFYKIRITDEESPISSNYAFETIISTRASSERVKKCVSDTATLKDWLDEYPNDSLETVKELVDDVVKEEGGIYPYMEDFFNKRPYTKAFSIKNWGKYNWYEKVSKILGFLLEGDGIRYSNVEYTSIKEDFCW